MKSPHLPLKKIWPEIGLLWLYLGARLYRLGLFPLFIDEAFHIGWARDTLALHPFGGVPDGKVLISWVIAPLLPYENAVWVSRAAVVLIGVMGLAALLGLGRQLIGRGPARLAGLVYIFLPYTFFFERLALADPLTASIGLIAAYLVAVGVRTSLPSEPPVAALPPPLQIGEGGRSERKPASGGEVKNPSPKLLLTAAGIALALAVLAKLPMVVFLAVPVLAWLLLADHKRQAIPRVLWIYAACALILIPVALVGWRTGSFGVSNAQRFTSTAASTLPERVALNIRLFVSWMGIYLGWPVLILGGLGMIWAVLQSNRRALFLAAIMLLPTLEFWAISTYPVPRYYLLGTGALLLLAAGFAWWVIDRVIHLIKKGESVTRPYAAIITIIILSMILWPMVRFVGTAYTDPAALRLAPDDERDYIRHSTSGYGLVDAVDWIEEQAAQGELTLICSAGITCERLSDYLYGTPNLIIERQDYLTPDRVGGQTVILAQDDPPHDQPFDPGTEYRLERLQRFERPGGQTAFELYAITPQP